MTRRTVALLLIAIATIAMVSCADGIFQTPRNISPLSPLDRGIPQQFSPLYFPVIANGQALPPAPFGVQMYGPTGQASKYFPLLAESGADWIRVPVSWLWVEPVNTTPERFRWYDADNRVRAYLDAGIDIILTIDDAPAWAAPGIHQVLYPAALPEFAEFMEAVAERYDGDGISDAPGSPVVTYYEMYNEPDAYCHGVQRWGAAGDKYAAMLKAIYPAVKQANPRAKIVLGGIAYDQFNTPNCRPGELEVAWPEQGGTFVFDFLDDVLAAGGGAYFDIMCFHYYFPQNWTFRSRSNPLAIGLVAKTQFVRAKLESYGLEKPIFVTESGKHSNGGTGDISATPIMQANHVTAFLTQARAADILFIWWLFFDTTPDDYPDFTGLVTNDTPPRKKLAYYAYQTAVKKLGHATFVRPLTARETSQPVTGFPSIMEAYQFTDRSGRPLYVAWLDPMWESAATVLRLPGRVAVVRDVFGARLTTVPDADSDGFVLVPVTGAPVYIEMGD